MIGYQSMSFILHMCVRCDGLQCLWREILQGRVLHFPFQGAKNHGVVMPDANKENTINQLVGAAFGAAGQRCMALSTAIFVGEAIEWLPELVERSKSLRVNAGESRRNRVNTNVFERN